MQQSYLTLIERGPESYGVFAPDIAGCIAFALTRDEAISRFSQAVSSHFVKLIEEGKVLPVPKTLDLNGSPYQNVDSLTLEWMVFTVPTFAAKDHA